MVCVLISVFEKEPWKETFVLIELKKANLAWLLLNQSLCFLYRTTEKEVMQSMYDNVIASNLSGLKMFIKSVPNQQQTSVLQLLENIITEKKFWKFAKSDISTVSW